MQKKGGEAKENEKISILTEYFDFFKSHQIVTISNYPFLSYLIFISFLGSPRQRETLTALSPLGSIEDLHKPLALFKCNSTTPQ